MGFVGFYLIWIQVEMLREEAYVPFDITFSKDDGCAKVITGPNMAGEY